MSRMSLLIMRKTLRLVVDLSKLEIRNFGQVLEADLNLANKGLVSIEGVNLDPTGASSNGAGKSTIINAILWCNYGEAGKPMKADSVVNNKTKKNCKVQCIWEGDKETYRITRYRKDTVWKNAVVVEVLKEHTWHDITKAGARGVQEQINDILGQDYLTFQASCFAQQNESLDIPALTDKGLKDLLERVLPFEDLKEQHKLASENLANNTKLIKQIDNKISLNEYKIELCRENGIKALAQLKSFKKSSIGKNESIEAKIYIKKQALIETKRQLIDIKQVKARISSIKEQIEKLGDCNLSRAVLAVEHAQKEYDDLKEKYDSADTRCYVCAQETQSKEDYRARLRPNLLKLAENLQVSKKAMEVIEAKVLKHHALKCDLDDLNKQVRVCDESLAAISRLESEIRLLTGQLVPLDHNPHTSAVEGFKTDFSQAKKTRAELQKTKEKLEAEQEILEAVEYTYSPKGVRYYMLESVAPTLTYNTNKYLNILTDGGIAAKWSTVVKTGTKDYKEKFRIDCFMDGKETEYGCLSGGEARKVRLACFFGLQDLIASRATKNISIWCGDEIDHALDAAGIERLMSLLDAKIKTKSTILVISHNELRDWIPNVAVVTRKNNVSVITGILNEN